MSTFKLVNIGCKVNAYELSAIATLLIKEGFQEDNQNPDVIIINTCSVTSTADQKSRQHIRKMKNKYPQAIIAVLGCYAQGNHLYIEKEIKPDIILGTSKRLEVVRLIKQSSNNRNEIKKDIDEDTRHFSYEELGITSFSENIRAYLKIQDGCDNFCTYCIVPYTRGKSRSRNKENIIEEAKCLLRQGYQEIVISGIHVGGYGKDLDGCSFSSLIDELSQIKEMKSLRISSIEISEIDDHLIKLIKERDNIAKHFHIPLQSGSNHILKMMNRKYTKEDFINRILQIKKEIPNIMISSDVIVGFPDEKEEDFLDTYDVCNKCFNMLHVFPYSARKGTYAAKLTNQIDPQIKKQRCSRLLELSNHLYEKYAHSFVGQDITVLVEKYDEKQNVYVGHTSNYLMVKIPNKESIDGQFITINLQKDMI